MNFFITWISSIIYCVALPNLSQIRAFLWLKRILIGIVYSTSRLIYKCYLIALRCLKFVCESKRKFPIFLFFLKHKCCCFFLLCTFCTGLIFGNGIFCKNFGIDFQNTGKITTSFIVSIYVKLPLNKARKEILMPFDSKRGLKKRHVVTMTMTFPTCHFSIALLSICNKVRLMNT